MLDLSSNADQFGVSVPVQSLAQVAIDGLSLVAPAASIGVFTLPPISWEPMLTKQALDASLPPPPNDGGPALLAADSVTLVPVAPKPLLAEYVHAVNQKRNFAARLPLPFGIIANINTRPQEASRDAPSPFITTGGVFDFHRPKFADDLVGARQLRLRAPEFAGMSRRFPPPSYTQTEDTDGYAAGMLSQDIHKRWQEDFGYGRRGTATPSSSAVWVPSIGREEYVTPIDQQPPAAGPNMSPKEAHMQNGAVSKAADHGVLGPEHACGGKPAAGGVLEQTARAGMDRGPYRRNPVYSCVSRSLPPSPLALRARVLNHLAARVKPSTADARWPSLPRCLNSEQLRFSP